MPDEDWRAPQVESHSNSRLRYLPNIDDKINCCHCGVPLEEGEWFLWTVLRFDDDSFETFSRHADRAKCKKGRT